MARNSAAPSLPSWKSRNAWRSRAGRRRLPMWSARDGGRPWIGVFIGSRRATSAPPIVFRRSRTLLLDDLGHLFLGGGTEPAKEVREERASFAPRPIDRHERVGQIRILAREPSPLVHDLRANHQRLASAEPAGTHTRTHGPKPFEVLDV